MFVNNFYYMDNNFWISTSRRKSKGNNGGKGNPVGNSTYRTSYLWEEVLQKDSLLDIVQRFIHLQEDKKDEQPQDATKKILNNEFYSSGKIYNIDENNIYFSNEDSKKYYINKNVFQYFNGRTAKSMDSVDIKVGDYLNQLEGKILIYRNVSGEELNQELLYNLTLDEDERIMMVNTIEIENNTILGSESHAIGFTPNFPRISLKIPNL